MQARGLGRVRGADELRAIVGRSGPVEHFEPQADAALWQAAGQRFHQAAYRHDSGVQQ